MNHYHNSGMTTQESANAPAPKGWDIVERWPALVIKLEQKNRKGYRFRVTYGLQVDDDLTYEQATRKLGEAMLHALSCNGQCNNDGD
jgi:hypothetical protein